jgi:hypothetical protein
MEANIFLENSPVQKNAILIWFGLENYYALV